MERWLSGKKDQLFLQKMWIFSLAVVTKYARTDKHIDETHITHTHTHTHAHTHTHTCTHTHTLAGICTHTYNKKEYPLNPISAVYIFLGTWPSSRVYYTQDHILKEN